MTREGKGREGKGREGKAKQSTTVFLTNPFLHSFNTFTLHEHLTQLSMNNNPSLDRIKKEAAAKEEE